MFRDIQLFVTERTFKDVATTKSNKGDNDNKSPMMDLADSSQFRDAVMSVIKGKGKGQWDQERSVIRAKVKATNQQEMFSQERARKEKERTGTKTKSAGIAGKRATLLQTAGNKRKA